ncbi:MAG: hypothetical protein ACLPKE_03680 [Streptosporangiaceae bacterium]
MHTPASAPTDSHWAGPRRGTTTADAQPAANAAKPIPTIVSSAADLASARALSWKAASVSASTETPAVTGAADGTDGPRPPSSIRQ